MFPFRFSGVCGGTSSPHTQKNIAWVGRMKYASPAPKTGWNWEVVNGNLFIAVYEFCQSGSGDVWRGLCDVAHFAARSGGAEGVGEG